MTTTGEHKQMTHGDIQTLINAYSKLPPPDIPNNNTLKNLLYESLRPYQDKGRIIHLINRGNFIDLLIEADTRIYMEIIPRMSNLNIEIDLLYSDAVKLVRAFKKDTVIFGHGNGLTGIVDDGTIQGLNITALPEGKNPFIYYKYIINKIIKTCHQPQ
jgi:hypothetical protein